MDEQLPKSDFDPSMIGKTVLVVGKIGKVISWAGPGLFDNESHYNVLINGQNQCYPEHLIIKVDNENIQ